MSARTFRLWLAVLLVFAIAMLIYVAWFVTAAWQ
jgi:hypothetical protein